jgi:hypothetical protein
MLAEMATVERASSRNPPRSCFPKSVAPLRRDVADGKENDRKDQRMRPPPLLCGTQPPSPSPRPTFPTAGPSLKANGDPPTRGRASSSCTRGGIGIFWGAEPDSLGGGPDRHWRLLQERRMQELMYLRGLGARRESGTDGAEGHPSGQRSPRGIPLALSLDTMTADFGRSRSEHVSLAMRATVGPLRPGTPAIPREVPIAVQAARQHRPDSTSPPMELPPSGDLSRQVTHDEGAWLPLCEDLAATHGRTGSGALVPIASTWPPRDPLSLGPRPSPRSLGRWDGRVPPLSVPRFPRPDIDIGIQAPTPNGFALRDWLAAEPQPSHLQPGGRRAAPPPADEGADPMSPMSDISAAYSSDGADGVFEDDDEG